MAMRDNKKHWFMLSVLAIVLVVSVEVREIKTASAALPAKPTTIRLMQAAEPDTVTYIDNIGTPDLAIAYNVMEPLVDVGKKGEIVPKLATKWEQLNPTTWRFYLRRGVKFQNGADFTASDVAESIKWFVDLKATSALYNRLPFRDAVAVDDHTVDLSFAKPQPLFLINARQFLIYPAAIARDKQNRTLSSPVGTGPYKFLEWVRGQYIRLAKFDGYWGPQSQINEVVITWRAEEGVRLAALIAREVDFVLNLNPESVSRAPKAVSAPSAENYFLRLDESVQKNPILADKRLRLAIDHAINRQAIVTLFTGTVTPLNGQFAIPGDFGYNATLKSRPYDLEKARSLVREAGAVGKSLIFVIAAGRWPKDREVAEAIAYMIEQTGLNVKLKVVAPEETKKYGNTIPENRPNIPDILLTAGDTVLEVESRYGNLLHRGGSQYAGNDPEASRLFEEVLAELDIAKRGEKLARAWAYNYEQAHFIPLIRQPKIWGLSKNLEWEPDIIGRPIIADFRFTQ